MAKIATRVTPLLSLVACLALASQGDASIRGIRPRRARSVDQVTPAAAGMEQFFFAETMADGDEPLVLLDEGPFKLTASCMTITYNYTEWDDIYYYAPRSYSSYYYSGSSSGSYSRYQNSTYSSSPFAPYSDASSSSPSPSPSSTANSPSSSYMDDFWYSYSWDDDWWYSPTHTESIAALELTYTANGTDYMIGMPSWRRYPHDDKLIGPYTAGENRTQIVFAGFDGGYSDSCTLTGTSGSYFTIHSDATVGTHKYWSDYLPGGDSSFPEGMDCMMAGIVSYITP